MSSTTVPARERFVEATDAHVEFLADLGQQFLDGELDWLPADKLAELTKRATRLAKEREAAAAEFMTMASGTTPLSALEARAS